MQTANIPLSSRMNRNLPTRIILHAMGEFIDYEGEDMYAPYFLKKVGLSAHALVTPNGTLIRCRRDEQGGAHCKGYNDTSLGVEFMVEGVHNYESFLQAMKTEYTTSRQLMAGVKLVKGWMIKFNIPIDQIYTHQELEPDRKYDPGSGFPLDDFKAMLSV